MRAQRLQTSTVVVRVCTKPTQIRLPLPIDLKQTKHQLNQLFKDGKKVNKPVRSKLPPEDFPR
jgi:hypothetical protein